MYRLIFDTNSGIYSIKKKKYRVSKKCVQLALSDYNDHLQLICKTLNNNTPRVKLFRLENIRKKLQVCQSTKKTVSSAIDVDIDTSQNLRLISKIKMNPERNDIEISLDNSQLICTTSGIKIPVVKLRQLENDNENQKCDLQTEKTVILTADIDASQSQNSSPKIKVNQKRYDNQTCLDNPQQLCDVSDDKISVVKLHQLENVNDYKKLDSPPEKTVDSTADFDVGTKQSYNSNSEIKINLELNNNEVGLDSLQLICSTSDDNIPQTKLYQVENADENKKCDPPIEKNVNCTADVDIDTSESLNSNSKMKINLELNNNEIGLDSLQKFCSASNVKIPEAKLHQLENVDENKKCDFLTEKNVTCTADVDIDTSESQNSNTKMKINLELNNNEIGLDSLQTLFTASDVKTPEAKLQQLENVNENENCDFPTEKTVNSAVDIDIKTSQSQNSNSEMKVILEVNNNDTGFDNLQLICNASNDNIPITELHQLINVDENKNCNFPTEKTVNATLDIDINTSQSQNLTSKMKINLEQKDDRIGFDNFQLMCNTSNDYIPVAKLYQLENVDENKKCDFPTEKTVKYTADDDIDTSQSQNLTSQTKINLELNDNEIGLDNLQLICHTSDDNIPVANLHQLENTDENQNYDFPTEKTANSTVDIDIDTRQSRNLNSNLKIKLEQNDDGIGFDNLQLLDNASNDNISTVELYQLQNVDKNQKYDIPTEKNNFDTVFEMQIQNIVEEKKLDTWRSPEDNLIEMVLIPDNSTDIQQFYDDEKDLISYSSNYTVSDDLELILSSQLNFETVEILRDGYSSCDNSENYNLSPISLRTRHANNAKTINSPKKHQVHDTTIDDDSPCVSVSDIVDDSHDKDFDTSGISHSSMISGESIDQDKKADLQASERHSVDAAEQEKSDSMPVLNDDVSTINSLKIVPISQKGSCDNSDMTVQSNLLEPRWKKKYACLYCNKTFVKLPRHIETVHKDIEDAIKLKNSAKGTSERKAIIKVMRNNGNFKYNTNFHINKGGELLVSRRPNYVKSALDYTTCPECLLTVTISNSRKHIYKCTKGKARGSRTYLVAGKTVEARLHVSASDTLRLVVFPVLQEDEIVRLIRYDWLIILYGNKLCLKYTQHYQHNMIRARLRLIGRFLHAAKSLNSEINELAKIYAPKYFQVVIDAIKIVARIDHLQNSCEAPAVAENLVTYIKQISEHLETEYIIKEDEANQIQLQKFMKIYKSEMSISINKIAMEAQSKIRRQKVELLPLTEDIQKLMNYLKSEKKMCFAALNKQYTYLNWLNCMKLTAVYLLVFNRRRVGDIQNILASDLTSIERIDSDQDKEEFRALDEAGKKIAEKYSRIQIRGKRGRTVAIIVNSDLIENIKTLLKHRNAANIPENNEFLFGLPNNNNDKIRVINLCVEMRKISVACGAEKPELLRGTHLRKHVATKCIELDLTDNAVSDVANHLGHSEKIHRDIYRLPKKSKTIVQVAKILTAVQGEFDEDNSDNDDLNDQNEFAEFQSYRVSNANEQHVNNVQHDFDGHDIAERQDTTCIPYMVDGNETLDTHQFIADGYDSPNNTQHVASKQCNNSEQYDQWHGLQNQASTSAGSSISKIKSTTPRDLKVGKTSQNQPPTEKMKVKFSKQRWTDSEKEIILSYFKQNIYTRTLPSLKQIDEIIKANPCLHGRSRQGIKTWISNQFKTSCTPIRVLPKIVRNEKVKPIKGIIIPAKNTDAEK